MKIAYELLEVRNGPELNTIYRTGKTPTGTVEAMRKEMTEVLTKAFGEDGKEKRANSARLKLQMDKAWDADGTSTRSFKAFIDYISA